MNIGIGVCSYRRPELATNLCKSILDTIDKSEYNITTVCSLDDTNTAGYEWISKNFNLIYGDNKGISKNKNRIIKHLYNNDFIFIAEDDIVFFKKGWLDLYLRAIEVTGFQHFNFILPIYRDNIKRTIKYDDITIGDSGPYVNGVLMVMSKKCLDLVGGFDDRYDRYGYEHVNYTNRCTKAGLYPDFNMHVMQTSKYLDWVASTSCLSEEDKQASLRVNSKLYFSPIKEIYNDSYKKAEYRCMT
jgi:GT2 family glycosyltransferase